MPSSSTKAARLNLIVLRSENMESLAAFYGDLLQVAFDKHRHGNGPEHMGAELNGLIFEIYPKREEGDSTTSIRLGFQIADIDAALVRVDGHDIKIVSEPNDSEWGKRMVLDDSEGHRIELTQTNQ